MVSFRILVINPGSTSTEVGVYTDEKREWERKISHSRSEIASFSHTIDQLQWRKQRVKKLMQKAGYEISDFDCISARGGVGLDPIRGGTYEIDEEMAADLRKGKNGDHVSNLAGLIALELGKKHQLPVYTVDPVAVDEFIPLARLSGLPAIQRRCQSHALILKATARRAAEEMNCKLAEINIIGVHLGGGISIAALKQGKIIDVNNANQGGPYSPQRTGTLPLVDFIEYLYEEQLDKNELLERLLRQGGLTAYLGTADGQEIENRIQQGNRKAELVYRGMIYQISKEIGAMSAVLNGEVKVIVITGGLAHSQYITKRLEEKIKFIAPVKIYPGAEEMKHLAAGALRVLKGQEQVLKYRENIVETGVLDD
ncbi:MAG: butyrate kinase [Halanaerobiales bacterium]